MSSKYLSEYSKIEEKCKDLTKQLTAREKEAKVLKAQLQSEYAPRVKNLI